MSATKKTTYESLSYEQKRIYHDRVKCRKGKLFGSADGLKAALEEDGVDVDSIDRQRLGPVKTEVN